MGAAALFLGNSGFRRLVVRWWELRRVKGELAALQAEEGDIQRKLESARRADPSLERAVRRELGYLKPGEVEYRFPPPGKPPAR